jgi:hypothetical protein
LIATLLQTHLVAHLAVRKGVPTHKVQRVAIRQLGTSQRLELLWRRVQFELGGQGDYHTGSISILHQYVNVTILMKMDPADWRRGKLRTLDKGEKCADCCDFPAGSSPE